MPRQYNISSFYIRNFKPPPSFCGCAGRFESYLVKNLEDRFSHDEAHIIANSISILDYRLPFPVVRNLWVVTLQNQQNECAPSEDSDQPGHPPSLIRVIAVPMKKAWVLSYPLSTQQRLWSDWADAQADLSLRWVHTHFVGFVMSWLKEKLLWTRIKEKDSLKCRFRYIVSIVVDHFAAFLDTIIPQWS